ncbi:MAG: translation initiation factor IF-3 [Deltaproteobacteria bacterium]|nr:translation initiation factor IF-3 [Deltaproteobacteria bacterium]
MDREGELRANERIRVPEVRLIGPDGEQIGVMPTYLALEKARDIGLDLVEVSPKANPPVCKVMDFGKYKYKAKKAQAEAKKRQTVIEVKEMKFRPKTDQHDFEHKIRRVRKFLEAGNKAKATIRFRGREMAHKDLGIDLMRRIHEAVEDVAVIEVPPSMEGRAMVMVMAPQKHQKS